MPPLTSFPEHKYTLMQLSLCARLCYERLPHSRVKCCYSRNEDTQAQHSDGCPALKLRTLQLGPGSLTPQYISNGSTLLPPASLESRLSNLSACRVLWSAGNHRLLGIAVRNLDSAGLGKALRIVTFNKLLGEGKADFQSYAS